MISLKDKRHVTQCLWAQGLTTVRSSLRRTPRLSINEPLSATEQSLPQGSTRFCSINLLEPSDSSNAATRLDIRQDASPPPQHPRHFQREKRLSTTLRAYPLVKDESESSSTDAHALISRQPSGPPTCGGQAKRQGIHSRLVTTSCSRLVPDSGWGSTAPSKRVVSVVKTQLPIRRVLRRGFSESANDVGTLPVNGGIRSDAIGHLVKERRGLCGGSNFSRLVYVLSPLSRVHVLKVDAGVCKE